MSRTPQAARTRRNLLRAAAEVFDVEGFAGSNLRTVCARARVTKGALYCHFRSKEALGVAIIEHQSLLWHELVDELLKRELGAVQTLVDLSFEFARRLESDLMVRVSSRLLREAAFFDLAAAGQFVGWISVVRDLLSQARACGELRDDVNLRHAAEQIVADFLGVQLVSQALTGQHDFTSRLRRHWRAWAPLLVTPETLRLLRFDPSDDDLV
ncbi:gamma-butyrolactone-binding protein [Lentzea sp. NBRC 105346]|uniref:ScbR family autoregulator-binding transcription factor n=1 Tax=Lentzea sp. NBRC 105346 TaxID=3032205 RepID=UPI0024A16244|nr:ScbR family autoregulator-binding transcription factor [Lentzea sp. NBRC 105346]GLZ33658.1 gamma-butyrolactone-binding protein [Lentzea sp. NBRC 105346]